MHVQKPPKGTRYKWDKHMCYKCKGENACAQPYTLKH